MGRDQRMGVRFEPKEPCEIQFRTRDEEKRDYEIEVLNLSSNAIATKISRNHAIVDDYGDVISRPVHIRHRLWVNDPDLENARRGFLSIARRLNSDYWKWVFFFDRKYPLPNN